MDEETRVRLERLEAKIDALSPAPHQWPETGPAMNSTLKSLIFWLVILAVLAVIWFFAR